jgi:hypothetical protein
MLLFIERTPISLVPSVRADRAVTHSSRPPTPKVYGCRPAWLHWKPGAHHAWMNVPTPNV